jgi:ATP-binding cassette, subfamily B, bacterial MsbA
MANAPADDRFANDSLRKRFRRVLSYFLLPKYAWFALVLSVIIGALLEPTIPALLKPLLDDGFNSKKIQLWIIPIAIIGLFTLRSFASYISDVALAKIAQFSLLNLREKMFYAVSVAELDLYRKQPATTLANTIVYEATNGAVLLLQSVVTVVKDSLSIVALFAYLLYLNWQLTLIVIFIFPAVALCMRLLSKRVYKLTKLSQAAVDKLAYTVEETVLAHKEIRIAGAALQQRDRFQVVNMLLQRLAMKSTIAGSAVAPITNILGSMALSVVITIAMVQSQGSALSAGGFVAFITAMLMLIAPIKHLSEVTSTITRGIVAAERAIALVEDVHPETGGTYCSDRSTGTIDFKNLGVTYPQAESAALSDISLHIQGGQFVALVGLSGSGKTTLASLLTRFVDASQGSVTLDGVELRDWNLISLRQQFALVGQHVVMLSDSVLANVTLGQQVDRARAQRCLASAYLGELIANLPQGMDTLLGHNASMLSGGERQRLAIARALYKDAPILILDEATSALDPDTDSLVQAALRTAMAGRTTIAIAHRLSTIRDADSIVVLQNGRILQQGSHAELEAQGGAYRDFIKLSYAPAVA